MVNHMLTEAMEKVLKEAREQSNEDLREARTQRRWLGTIIVTVGVALAALIYHLH